MEKIQLSLGVFARYASLSPQARDRRAAEISRTLATAYDPATDYWKKPREAICHASAAGNLRGALADVRFESKDPNRIRNYEKAIEDFLAWWDPFSSSPVKAPPSVLVGVDPFEILVKPHLEFTLGDLRYLVRVRFIKGTALLQPERVVTTSLIWEAFPDSMPSILDLETGEFTNRRGSNREVLDKVAADLASRWPSR